MRVVVTGAAGFVGAAVVRSFAEAGAEVHAVVRPVTPRRRLESVRGLKFVVADFCTEEGRAAIARVGADACVHAAWGTEPGRYLSSMENVELASATSKLAFALAEGGCKRFVGVGTCFEYETGAGYLSERTPLGPAHLYSAAKAGTFLAVREVAALTGLSAAWARLFYLYGPTEHPKRLVPAVACALLRGDLARATKGEQVRDFLHVDDAGSALRAVTESDVEGAINVASGKPVTVAGIVLELALLCGRPDLVRLGAIEYSAKDPMFVCADIGRLRASTGWQPRYDLRSGLADAVSFWRSELAASP